MSEPEVHNYNQALKSPSGILGTRHFHISCPFFPLWFRNKSEMIKWEIILMAGRRNNFDLESYWSHILAAATRAVAFLLVCCLIRVTRQLLTAVSLPKKDGCPLWPERDSALYYFYLRGEKVWGYFFFPTALNCLSASTVQKSKNKRCLFAVKNETHGKKNAKYQLAKLNW